MVRMYWQSAYCRLSIFLSWNKDFLPFNCRDIVIFRLFANFVRREQF